MKADSWRLVTLGDLIDIKHGFAFKGKFFRDSPPGDILLTPGNFAIGGGFKSDKFKYYAGDVPEGFVLKEGELLVTMTDLSKAADTLGYPALVPKASANSRFLHNQRLGKILISSNRTIRKDFLYYLLQTKPYRHEVIASATGTTVKHTSPERIKAFRFLLPSEKEQKAIARILGTLDDKIELNQQMNRTLEATARAIFKSWFVDFDPVRAKMDGRQPGGMDAQTAALFPDGFEDSELGMIPKGWRVTTFDRIISILNGGTPKTSVSEYWNGNIPWFSVKDTPATSDLFILNTERKITKLGLEKSSTQILTTGTTIISARGTVGKVALVGVDMAMNQSCFGIKGQNGYSDLFVYYQLRTLISELQQNTHGSVFDTINRDTFKSIKTVVSSPLITQKFDTTINAVALKIKSNLVENKSLSTFRDTLLPKLMSGEIRVTEAEKMVENVT